jgi:hypothetical protein
MACYLAIFTFTLNKYHYARDPVDTREHVFLPKQTREYLSRISLSDCETCFVSDQKARICFQIAKTMTRKYFLGFVVP